MWRLTTAAVLAALTLVACGGSQTTTTRSPPAPTTGGQRTIARCSALKTGYVGTQGATGHLEVTVSLRNVSRQTCRIEGYPAARLLDRAGHPLPMRLQRGHGFFPDTLRAPRRVVLAPGARARFGLSFVTNNEFAGAHVCRTAVAALAGMPGWTGARRAPVSLRSAPRLRPCGDQLVVSPVYA